MNKLFRLVCLSTDRGFLFSHLVSEVKVFFGKLIDEVLSLPVG